MSVLFSDIRPCNGLDTIVDNGRKKTMFRLLLDTALKTVAYRWQVIQIVETLVHRQVRFIPIKEGIEFDGQQDLRTKVMIAAGSYVVFQQQSGRYPDVPSGAPDHVVRTVTENSRTLKFTSQGFEKE